MLSLSQAIKIRLANLILPKGFCVAKEEKVTPSNGNILIFVKGQDYDVRCTNSKAA